MIRSLVRAVIQDAHVTHTAAGLLQVDAFVLRAAEILPFEEVEMVNNTTGERMRTWIEPGQEGSGEIRVPSGARQGDPITIICYGLLHDGQTLDHKPRIVRLDSKNQVLAAT